MLNLLQELSPMSLSALVSLAEDHQYRHEALVNQFR